MSYRIAQISDTHLSRERPFFVANFQRVAAHLRRARPDLVINTGDLALDGVGRGEDLEEALRLHEALDLPVRCIPGNHDVGDNQDTPAKGMPTITAEARGRYIRLFGSDYWLVDVPGWRIVAVNAQLLGSDLAAAAEQLEFVSAAAVAASPSSSIALLVHKPLFHLSADEEQLTGRFVNPLPRRQLLEAFGSRQPKLVASGHVHQHFSNTTRGGAQHVWGPSTGFILPDTHQPLYGSKEVGYVEHMLTQDGSHTSRFVAVPGLARSVITDFPEAYDGLI